MHKYFKVIKKKIPSKTMEAIQYSVRLVDLFRLHQDIIVFLLLQKVQDGNLYE